MNTSIVVRTPITPMINIDELVNDLKAQDERFETVVDRKQHLKALVPKTKYCVHGFIPDYCARCKFGELIH